MKKMITGFVSCTLLITSCSQNEMLDGPSIPNNDGKIKFSAVKTLASTKAAADNPYGGTNDLQKMVSFDVVGYGIAGTSLENVAYVNHRVTWSPATGTWEYSNEPYWPDHAMNFYAVGAKTVVEDRSTEVTLDKADGITIIGFKTGSNGDNLTASASQIDLVVASHLGAIKENRTLLMFKHALTQINFKTMVIDDSGLDIVIEKVYLHNVKHTADFKSLPNISSTGLSAVDYRQDYWTGASGLADYDASPSVAFNLRAKDAVGTAGSVAEAKLITSGVDNLSLLLIPQNFVAWDNNAFTITNNDDNNTIATPMKLNGAYIELSARISKEVKDEDGVDVTVYYLGSESTYGLLYIPVSSEGLTTNDKTNAPIGQWVPGRNINYIITFGDTGSGSGGGGYDGEGEPTLVPIRFHAELEEWVEYEVPLLTATVTGNSANVTDLFVNSYVNQVFNDIKAATEIKTFKATVKITGAVTTAFILDFGPFGVEPGTGAIAKMKQGSTFTYDFSGITSGASITIPAAPTGWEFIKADGTAATPATGADVIILRKQ